MYLFTGKKRTQVARKAAPKDNPLEKAECMALTSWFRYEYPNELLAHVANENQETKMAEGLVSGYPDYTLDCARGGYFGLRIEMKRRKSGEPSDNQLKIGLQLTDKGYAWACCAGWQEAKMIIEWYMNLSPTLQMHQYHSGLTEHGVECGVPQTKHSPKMEKYIDSLGVHD